MSRLALPRAFARDPHEEGRTASPLELFFDLVFVVAVAMAAENLHHFESEDHFSTGILRYLMVFFGIWWAWMNFTWFASAFDTDDWLYRVLTLTQMAGALIMAAGVPNLMNQGEPGVMFAGYVLMRLALVPQWLRVARDVPEYRTTALRYAGGVTTAQAYWLLYQFVPENIAVPLYFLGGIIELAVPVVAERAGMTPWHPHHIAERYGLFTMIVLGESILAASNAIIDALEESGHKDDLILLAGTGFMIVASIWWIYFAYPQAHHLTTLPVAIQWGYGHFFIFAAVAAGSAGIEVAVDYDTRHTGLDAARAAATLCVPVAIFLLVTWFLTERRKADRLVNVAVPSVAALVLVAIFLPWSLQVAAVLLVLLVVLITWQTGTGVALRRAGAHGERGQHPT